MCTDVYSCYILHMCEKRHAVMPDLNDDFVKMHAAWLLLFFDIDMQDKLIMVKLYTSNI